MFIVVQSCVLLQGNRPRLLLLHAEKAKGNVKKSPTASRMRYLPMAFCLLLALSRPALIIAQMAATSSPAPTLITGVSVLILSFVSYVCLYDVVLTSYNASHFLICFF